MFYSGDSACAKGHFMTILLKVWPKLTGASYRKKYFKKFFPMLADALFCG